MIELSKAEIDDLRDLNVLCKRMNADLVVVGAIAYQFHFSDDKLKTDHGEARSRRFSPLRGGVALRAVGPPQDS